MSLHINRITGRRWISIGPLHLGFGPYRLLERIQWRSKLVWFNQAAWWDHIWSKWPRS